MKRYQNDLLCRYINILVEHVSPMDICGKEDYCRKKGSNLLEWYEKEDEGHEAREKHLI